MPGKTRTSQAHGPQAAKKPFKRDPAANPRTATAAAARGGAHAAASGSNRDPVDRKRKAEDEPEKATVRNSLLNAPEEIDFPRGGGSGLTQVEVREAQLEGENEAKAAQDEERERDTEVIKDKGKAKRRKLERALKGAVKEKNQLPKDAFRIEHLNYKRLIPGTKALCQVVQVRPLELIVSLPNQLLGHIPITNISAEFTARLEKAGEESSDEEDSDEEEDSEDEADADKPSKGLPGLTSLFRPGQWLVAIVAASKTGDSKTKLGGREGDEAVRSSRRIELSLEPEKVNEGIAKGDLKRGFILPAAVHDVEEHGYTLSFGLAPLSSFLPFADAKKLSPTKPLHVGQVVLCRITKVHDNERTLSVTVEHADLAGTTLDSVSSITSVLPFQLVPCLVTAVLPSGLNVKFHGYFDGTIDRFHLPVSAGDDLADHYKQGQKVKARVLWDSIASTPKKFALSMAPHVVRLDDAAQATERRFQVGAKCKRVKVVAMDDEWGLTCEIQDGEEAVPAFVHISRITDDHLNTIPKSGPWKAGTVHAARVIGFSALDNLVQLSLQPSVLEQVFLRVQDVEVGAEVKGTVKVLKDNALFVSIGGNVDGVVWPLHYADIRLKHPEKKFKPGQSVKARIYSADPEKNRVVLTLKKQLVNTDLPIVARIEDAKVGVVTHATVTKVLEKSVLIDFFGGLRALIPAAEAAEAFTAAADLVRLFPLGKVVAVRILSVDPATSRIVASARQASAPSAAAASGSASIEALDIGTVTSGTVSALHETNLVLSLVPSGVKALLSYPTLARHRGVQVADLKASLAKGQSLEDLVVVSKNADKGFVIVGLLPSKSAASAGKPAQSTSSSAQLTLESLEVGALYPGRISSRLPSGVILVQLASSGRNAPRGRVALTELADAYAEDLASAFPVGAHVDAVVLAKDTAQHRLDLSLRASRVAAAKGEAAPEVQDPVVESVEQLKPGEKVRGFVKAVANAGVFVTLGGEVTARVQIKELFDEYVKDWKPRFTVGQLVEGKVLSVDKVTSQVELSLRKGGVVKKGAEPDLPSLAEANLSVGQVVRGVVKRVEDFGAFVRLDGLNVQGLCHKSKVTDETKGSWKEHVHQGDRVRVVVLDVNLETKKVSLGLKKSLFPEGEASDEEEDDEESGEEEEEIVDGMSDDDEEDGSGDEVDLQALLNSAAAGSDDEEEDDEDEDEDDEMADEPEVPVASTSKLASASSAKVAPALAVSSGFNWGGDEEDEEMQAAKDDDEDSDDEEPAAPKPSATAAGKKAATGLSTLDDRTGDLDTQAPTSIADFERLLLGSPNSSYLWIQYIAFFVGLTQLDKAREIGRRALKSIHFREEQEKLNVWVALLNLENSYGDETTVDERFKEAAQYNDAKTVHLRMLDIYERTGKYEAEEELFKRTVKKFSQSSKVWTLFAQYYLTHGRPAEARELLPRSLKSLEKRKHVKTIVKFAQLEFKLGDAERGRTIFEGIVDSYPKRLDLWFVYIDMEIKQRNVAGVRALFDRVLAQRLSSKKGKSVFKKWLTFEKEHGDDAGVDEVKERAVAFVQGRQHADGGADEDDEE
ncbi:rRNA bioproteinsis protein rrp5 [Rhodotorula kratochvilovae]